MNLKLAKKLRKEARTLTGGIRISDYVRNKETNALELDPQCTRYYYKQFKKLARQR